MKTSKKNAETKVRWNVIKNMQTIYFAIRADDQEVFEYKSYKKALERLCGYFGVSETQVWILCCGIYCFITKGGCDGDLYLRDFADFLNKDIFDVMQMHDDFKYLSDINLIDFDEILCNYIVKRYVIKAVVNNVHISEEKPSEMDSLGFISFMADKIEQRRYTDASCSELIEYLNYVENKNSKLSIVSRCCKMIPDDRTRYMFYDMCNDFIQQGKTGLWSTLRDIYDGNEMVAQGREYMDENSFLIKKGLIEFVDKESMSEASLTLTEKGKKLFLDNDASLFTVDENIKGVISPEKIVYKKMFYSEEIKSKIDTISECLISKKYQLIHDKLVEKGYGSGVCVLFHGMPGTGKTETVYQIAKRTGRKIMQVDISSSKSCWFGESEKIIKKIFVDYEQLCSCASRKGEQVPVLLFNEADAIFGKRKDTSTSNTAQTENAIQNIILEQMEKFEGILFATTNLVDNLDSAFERRFLYKVNFKNPCFEARKCIWTSKMNWLSDDEAEILSLKYDFSGGEIDNIVRKVTMQEIVAGKEIDFSSLKNLCDGEKIIQKNEEPIGFFA